MPVGFSTYPAHVIRSLISILLILLCFPAFGAAQSRESGSTPKIHWIVDGREVNTPAFVKKIFTSDTLVPENDSTKIRAQILQHYYSEGYLSARIDSLRFEPEGNRPSISGVISRGCAYTIDTLQIKGADEELFTGFELFLGQGRAYSRPNLEREIERIISYFEEEGYPLIRVQIADIRRIPEECRVDVVLDVQPGDKMRVDGLMFPQLDNVDQNYIRTASGVTDSALITPRLLRSVRQRLQNTGFFKQVGEPEIVLKEQKHYLQIPLEERNPNLFDLVVGYIPETGKGGTFVGDGQLRIRNIFWPGSTTYLEFERQRRLVTKLNLGFQRDWILGIPFGAGVDFRFLQQDTTYQVRDFAATGSYDLNASTTLKGKIRRKVTAGNRSLERTVDVLDAEGIYGGLGITYMQLDDRLTPTEGIEVSAELQTGVKTISDERAVQGGIDNRISQRILEIEIQPFISPFRRHVLTPTVHGFFLDAKQFTVSDLTRFGGAQSLRGYREDQFRASRLVWGDLEYRYLLDPATYGFVFGAAGYYRRPRLVTESTNERQREEWLRSWGIGFSYNTGIGRLKFSYAISPKDALNNGKVHFGLVANL